MRESLNLTGDSARAVIEDEQFWESHFNQMAASGLSRAAYCREHQLNYGRSQYWYQKHRSKTSSKLVPITLKSPCTQEVWCRIELNESVSVAICSSAAFDHLLTKIMHHATVV